MSCSTYPAEVEQPLRVATAEDLLQRLRTKEQTIGSLKALFRANIQGDGVPVAYRVDGVFLYRRPNTIRLKGFSRFGNVVFDFLLDREHYSLELPDRGQLYTGLVGELKDNKSVSLPVQLSLRAFDAMLGRVIQESEPRIDFIEEGDRYRFDLGSPLSEPLTNSEEFTRRVWVERRHLEVDQMAYLSPSGKPTHIIKAKDFRRVKDDSPIQKSTVLLPFYIEAEDMEEKGSVSLNFQEMVINSPLGPKEFGLLQF